jgi:hypothetical protein
MQNPMRRLIAVLLSLVSLALLGLVFLAPRVEARGQVNGKHVCSATDKQFLEITKMNMTILGYWSESLVGGDATHATVIGQVRSVIGQVSATRPQDPSLAQTKTLLIAMFGEYLRAVRAGAKQQPAGPFIMRSYGLANSARDVLVDGQPGLAKLGCDVQPLL